MLCPKSTACVSLSGFACPDSTPRLSLPWLVLQHYTCVNSVPCPTSTAHPSSQRLVNCLFKSIVQSALRVCRSRPAPFKDARLHLWLRYNSNLVLQADKLMQQWRFPNTYCFSKHLAESLMATYHRTAFPVTIVRPSIIGGLAGTPLPGYVGNTAGSTGAALAIATGLLSSAIPQ